MSIRVMTDVWGMRDVPAIKKIVLLYLADKGDDDGESIWPSMDKIALECGMSKRQVRFVMRWLEEEKISKVVHEAGTQKKSRVYAIDTTRIRQFRGNEIPPKGEQDSSQGGNEIPPNHPLEPSVNREGESLPLHERFKTTVLTDKDLYTDRSNSTNGSRGCRLPENWLPGDADCQFALDQGMTPDALNREADKFRDYWLAKTGATATKRDWSATWRNWIRRAMEDRGGYHQPANGASTGMAGSYLGQASNGHRRNGGSVCESIARAAANVEARQRGEQAQEIQPQRMQNSCDW